MQSFISALSNCNDGFDVYVLQLVGQIVQQLLQARQLTTGNLDANIEDLRRVLLDTELRVIWMQYW